MAHSHIQLLRPKRPFVRYKCTTGSWSLQTYWRKLTIKLFFETVKFSSRSLRPTSKNYQTAGPARMGMLHSVQAGAVRYGGFPARSEVAHAKGRGDGNPAVRVHNVDPRQGALR